MWVWRFTFHLWAALSVGSTGGGFLFVLAVAALSEIEVGMTARTNSVVRHLHPSKFLFA